MTESEVWVRKCGALLQEVAARKSETCTASVRRLSLRARKAFEIDLTRGKIYPKGILVV